MPCEASALCMQNLWSVWKPYWYPLFEKSSCRSHQPIIRIWTLSLPHNFSHSKSKPSLMGVNSSRMTCMCSWRLLSVLRSLIKGSVQGSTASFPLLREGEVFLPFWICESLVSAPFSPSSLCECGLPPPMQPLPTARIGCPGSEWFLSWHLIN